MKKFYFFLLLISHEGYSQNWSPFYVNERYNYRLNTADIISANFFTDSVKMQGNDSVFYLNRIFQYQPQFWQSTMLKMDSGVYIFRSPNKISLPVFAKLNYTWLFDSTMNFSGTVVSLQVDSIFGDLDSVKVIALSNNDTIKLSEHYGLIKFPLHYNSPQQLRLTGIRGRNLGELMPDFISVWGQFKPGDLLTYFNGGWCGCPDAQDNFQATEYKILSGAIITADTEISYNCLEQIVTGEIFEIAGSLIPIFPDTMPVAQVQWVIRLSDNLLLRNMACNSYIPMTGYDSFGHGILTLDRSFHGLETITIGAIPGNGLFSDTMIFVNGIGILSQYAFGGESITEYNLTCASVIDSFPVCSEIYPLGILETGAPLVKASPNPFVNNIEIKDCPMNATITISNITGEIIYMRQAVTSDFQVNLNNGPAGVYIIQVSDKNIIYRQKLIKQD